MNIRSYKSSDYDSIKELLTACDLFDKSYDTPEKLATKTPEGSIIVAEDNSRLVGSIFFTYDGWDSSIYRLAVHPNYRRQSLGTRLLQEAENRLKNLGADIASLRVHVDNKEAQEFFRKRGYVTVGGPYSDLEKKL